MTFVATVAFGTLSAIGDIRRAALGKDGPFEATQSSDRLQCRSRAGALARQLAVGADHGSREIEEPDRYCCF